MSKSTPFNGKNKFWFAGKKTPPMAEVSDVWTHQKRQNPFTSLGNSLQSCKGPWRNPRRNATDSATRNQTRCALKSALRIVKLCCAVPLPCCTFLGFLGGKQGSSPNRGQSLVEWGDFLSVLLFFCPSICPSIHPFPPLGHQTRHEAQIWGLASQAWGQRLRLLERACLCYWSKSAKKTFVKVLSVPLYSHINYNKFKQTTKNLRHVFGGPPGRLQLHLEASGINQTRYNQRDFLKTHPGSSWQAIPAHSGPVACVCPLQTFN